MESPNGKLRDEPLEVEILDTLPEAQVLIEATVRVEVDRGLLEAPSGREPELFSDRRDLP